MPYDPEQVARQRSEQRAMERESSVRQRAAGTSPMKSSGGKGWTGAEGSGSDKAADSPGKYDGGAAKPSKALTAEESGGAKDTGGPAKSYGIDSGDQDPMGYLGHFGRDDVASRGHNKGHKPIGKAPVVRTVAPKGYRKLPGSASPVQGKAMAGALHERDLGLRPTRQQRVQEAKAKSASTRLTKKLFSTPIPLKNGDFGSPTAVSDLHLSSGRQSGKMPPTPSDKKMSVRHHEDSIRYNRRHAEDHERAIVKHERELKTVQRSLRGKRK